MNGKLVEFINQYNHQKRQQQEEIEENYQEKAQRLLSQKKFRERYHRLLKHQAVRGELPSVLNQELLQTALQINFVRLLLRLEEKGLEGEKVKINFIQAKGKITDLLARVPQRSEETDRLSKEEEEWLKDLHRILGPINQVVAQEFPHDSAYLLSQILEYNQAVCAGKAMMLAMVFRALGLAETRAGPPFEDNSPCRQR